MWKDSKGIGFSVKLTDKSEVRYTLESNGSYIGARNAID